MQSRGSRVSRSEWVVACVIAGLVSACGEAGDDPGTAATGGAADAGASSEDGTSGASLGRAGRDSGSSGSSDAPAQGGDGGSSGATLGRAGRDSGSSGSSDAPAQGGDGGSSGATLGGAGGSGGGAGTDAPAAGGDGDGGSSSPTFGYPVYTQAEIDAWDTSSAEYTRLANSWAGRVDRAHTSYGTEISSSERDVLKDEAVFIKVQAVLWAADGDAERHAKVTAMLDELRSVTSWEWDAGEQYRLVAGWVCTNLAQAAAIIDYRDPEFVSFLVDECYPILDWTNGPNWHASFADSKVAIAAYVGDSDLWEDAKEYFYARIGQSIYHSAYDGDTVLPLLNDNGRPNVGLTTLHWGGGVDASQINDDFTAVNPAQFPDGVNAERMRDLGHVSMGLGAFMHAARTVLAQGDMLEPHAYTRLREAYAHHGFRVLTYLNTGTIPEPEPIQGDGGSALKQGWLGACKLFGDDTPTDVLTLCSHEEVTGFAAAGANHLVAEAFADQ